MNNINNQNGGSILGKIRKFISKGFLTVIIICTIAYLALLINKNKSDKKYFIALISIFSLTLLASWFPLRPAPPILLIKLILLIIPSLVLFILNILIGQDKY